MRLLVVDDEEGICELVSEIAADRGFDVVTVGETARVLDAVGTFQPDVILLDLMMPGTDGVELLRLLADKAQHTKICLMSGADSRVLNSARRLGHAHGLDVFAVLEKPIDIAVLRNALDQIARNDATPLDELNITRAMENGEIAVFYQPCVDIATRNVVSFEALVRWNHPVRGVLMPDDFLDLAIQSGVMAPLTHHILGLAVAEAASWQHQGETMSVAVNLATSSLLDLSLPDRIADLCMRHGVSNNRLVIEITETEAMRDIKRSMDVLVRLRLRGFTLAIDDFGTGYSSLRELQRMPFDTMKIDKSFVLDLPSNRDSQIIVKAVIDLGHDLGLKVVAEGVEDSRSWNLLIARGCDLAQGYLIGRPMPPRELAVWLAQWRTETSA